jgi:hypothetical protein
MDVRFAARGGGLLESRISQNKVSPEEARIEVVVAAFADHALGARKPPGQAPISSSCQRS